jgi:hypothetical protein
MDRGGAGQEKGSDRRPRRWVKDRRWISLLQDRKWVIGTKDHAVRQEAGEDKKRYLTEDQGGGL